MAFSSKQIPSNTCLLLMLVLSLCNPLVLGNTVDGPDFVQPEFLKIESSDFVGSVSEVIDVLDKVTSILSHFGNAFGDGRTSKAISDCLDMFDLSSDVLRWTASTAKNPGGNHNGTGNVGSDLKTWLSYVRTNPDTCIEGFEGSNAIVKSLISPGLNRMTSLVKGLLSQVHPVLYKVPPKYSQFPSWVKPGDRKLLQSKVVPDVVVAADGTGNFTTISDAVLAAPDLSLKRFVIYIKKGIYREYVDIKKKKWNLMMIGDGMNATIITGNRSFIDGWTTFRTATFAVSGKGFIGQDISFENTAGPEKHQAVALRSDSDLSVFYRCGIFGYQDSLYAHAMRQFYRECKISGTVDFIFGDATAVFQKCDILARKGLPSQKNTITAHGRKDPNESTGFSFQFCNISAHSDLLPVVNSTQTYLGRPWKLFSRTAIMQSYISNVLRPEGWLEWNGAFALDTLYYAEYMNTGPGAGLANRINWPGFHVLNETGQANSFTVTQFIEGNLWLPPTGVAFSAGLQLRIG